MINQGQQWNFNSIQSNNFNLDHLFQGRWQSRGPFPWALVPCQYLSLLLSRQWTMMPFLHLHAFAHSVVRQCRSWHKQLSHFCHWGMTHVISIPKCFKLSARQESNVSMTLARTLSVGKTGRKAHIPGFDGLFRLWCCTFWKRFICVSFAM